MAKIILILLTFSFLTACKKEYTCECLRETGYFLVSYTIKEKKKKAEEKCKSTILEGSSQLDSYCKLK